MPEIKTIIKNSRSRVFKNAGRVIYFLLMLIFLSLVNKPSGFDNLLYLQFVLLSIFIFEFLNVCYIFFMAPIYENFDFNEVKFLNQKSYLFLVIIFLFLTSVSLFTMLAPVSVLEFYGFPTGPDTRYYNVFNLLTILFDIIFLLIYIKLLILISREEYSN